MHEEVELVLDAKAELGEGHAGISGIISYIG